MVDEGEKLLLNSAELMKRVGLGETKVLLVYNPEKGYNYESVSDWEEKKEKWEEKCIEYRDDFCEILTSFFNEEEGFPLVSELEIEVIVVYPQIFFNSVFFTTFNDPKTALEESNFPKLLAFLNRTKQDKIMGLGQKHEKAIKGAYESLEEPIVFPEERIEDAQNWLLTKFSVIYVQILQERVLKLNDLIEDYVKIFFLDYSPGNNPADFYEKKIEKLAARIQKRRPAEKLTVKTIFAKLFSAGRFASFQAPGFNATVFGITFNCVDNNDFADNLKNLVANISDAISKEIEFVMNSFRESMSFSEFPEDLNDLKPHLMRAFDKSLSPENVLSKEPFKPETIQETIQDRFHVE